jgi:hypothetical protein
MYCVHDALFYVMTNIIIGSMTLCVLQLEERMYIVQCASECSLYNTVDEL